MQSRRTFLRNAALASAGLALPHTFDAQSVLADTIGAATAGTGSTPKRFVFIRKSNGMRPNELALPSFTNAQAALDTEKRALTVDMDRHDLPAWLQGLEPYREHLGILQGMSCRMSENGHHSFSSVMGCFKSGRNSLSGIKRATIDFELGKLFPSPFGHVELALRGVPSGIIAGFSAPGPHQRNYCYADPETAYRELFKSVLNPKAVNNEEWMLKFLQEEETFRSQALAQHALVGKEAHVQSIEAIRERNRLLLKMGDKIAQHMPELDPVHLNGGVAATTPEKQAAMTEILCAALITGLTNVVTFTIDELPTPVTGLPGNEADQINIHQVGHYGGYSGVPAETIRENLRKLHMSQVATIVERLKAQPEGNGTMFDNTVIMYFAENGETHHSHGWETPFVVIAGEKTGLDMARRYTRVPYHANEGHKTLGNWYTTLLRISGSDTEHYGDLDPDMGRLQLPQTGEIRQLMA